MATKTGDGNSWTWKNLLNIAKRVWRSHNVVFQHIHKEIYRKVHFDTSASGFLTSENGAYDYDLTEENTIYIFYKLSKRKFEKNHNTFLWILAHAPETVQLKDLQIAIVFF